MGNTLDQQMDACRSQVEDGSQKGEALVLHLRSNRTWDGRVSTDEGGHNRVDNDSQEREGLVIVLQKNGKWYERVRGGTRTSVTHVLFPNSPSSVWLIPEKPSCVQ